MLSVHVILVNYKNHEKTIRCLRALEKGNVKPNTAYVIDNASTEESRNYFKNNTFSYPVTWIYNQQNFGFAVACNQGIRIAQEKDKNAYIWLLNNDTLPTETALEKLINTAKKLKTGITGSLIKDNSGSFSGGVGFIHPRLASVRRPHSSNEKNFNYVEGSSFLISPECFQSVGYLSEDYFLYFEESDYCIRAKRKGFKIGWATDSIIIHDIGSSTGSENGKGNVPFFIDCLMIRNRIHFAKKNGFPTTGRFISLAISLILRIKRLQFARIAKIIQIVFSEQAFKRFIENNGGSYKISSRNQSNSL